MLNSFQSRNKFGIVSTGYETLKQSMKLVQDKVQGDGMGDAAYGHPGHIFPVCSMR
jgi:hypothetical protein